MCDHCVGCTSLRAIWKNVHMVALAAERILRKIKCTKPAESFNIYGDGCVKSTFRFDEHEVS
jgi:hypothetical protein